MSDRSSPSPYVPEKRNEGIYSCSACRREIDRECPWHGHLADTKEPSDG